jgi:Mn2+/Fe2+ NRAMP family transporter
MSEPSAITTKDRSTTASSKAPSAEPAGLWKALGPGLVTGAADDDPSGIATYSQVSAQFGYGLAWTMLFSFPLMTVIQAVAARIGGVRGFGIAQNLRRHYSPWLLRAVVLLLIVANIINFAADLGAMGSALKLMIGGRSSSSGPDRERRPLRYT